MIWKTSFRKNFSLLWIVDTICSLLSKLIFYSTGYVTNKSNNSSRKCFTISSRRTDENSKNKLNSSNYSSQKQTNEQNNRVEKCEKTKPVICTNSKSRLKKQNESIQSNGNSKNITIPQSPSKNMTTSNLSNG